MTTIACHPNAHQASNRAQPGLFARLRDLFELWSARQFDRAQLAQWTDRDLHDAGISRADIAYELNKPFWRG